MKIVNLLNRLKLIFLLLFICNLSYSQYTNLPLGYNFNLNLELEFEQNIQHSSFKPIILSSENIDVESIIERNFFSNNNFLSARLFNKHLIEISGEDYYVGASLLSNLSYGNEMEESLRTFTNTRGFVIDGYIGQSISFQTSFVENQAVFPNYIDSLIRTQDFVVPGQGWGRTYYDNGFDYAKSSALLLSIFSYIYFLRHEVQ